MSNNISIMVVCSDEDSVVSGLAASEDISLNKVSNPEHCGGTQDLYLTSYGCSYKCLSKSAIVSLIGSFKAAPFLFPELAVLIINDDSLEEISGVYTIGGPDHVS